MEPSCARVLANSTELFKGLQLIDKLRRSILSFFYQPLLLYLFTKEKLHHPMIAYDRNLQIC